MKCMTCNQHLDKLNCQRIRQGGRVVFATVCDSCRLSSENRKYAKRKSMLLAEDYKKLRAKKDKLQTPPEIVEGIRAARASNVSISETAKLFGVCATTVYKYSKRGQK